jgi:hypothetical protein
VAVVVGALINVAMAWSCAQLVPLHRLGQWDPPDPIPERLIVPIPDEWLTPVHEPEGRINVTYAEFGRFGATARLVEVFEQTADQRYQSIHSHSRWEVGWPMRVFGSVIINGHAGTPPERHGVLALPGHSRSGDESQRSDGQKFLPARVLPLGFAVNTLLYAAAALALSCSRTVLRWYARRWNDQRLWVRTASRLAPCGVLGVIASVLVAWSCMLWVPVSKTVTSRRFLIQNPTEHWLANHRKLATAPQGQWTDGILFTDPLFAHPWNGTAVVSSEDMGSRFESLERLDDTTFPHYAKRVGVYALQEWLGVETGFGVRFDYLSLEAYSERGAGGPSFQDQRAGWPLHCVRAFDAGGESGPVGRIKPPPWLHARKDYPRTRCLLSVPLWTGLMGDTFFYGCLIWCALFGPGILRRARRAAKNQCVWCGYDRRGLDDDDKCPECGAHPTAAK